MAVKKVENKNVEVENKNVEVETPVTTEEVVAETPVVETPVVEVETPKAEVEVKSDVEIDTKNVEVNANNKPNASVKIRMRVDHKCCIAMERYDLKAGKVYVVPMNVKNILNKAGYLAPL